MLTEFCANTELHPNRIDLNWSWQDANPIAPALRLVRRQRAYSGQVDDGFTVLDLAELSPADGLARWQLIEHTRYLTVNSNAEGGLLQAEMVYCLRRNAGTVEQQVVIGLYDQDERRYRMSVIKKIKGISRTEVNGPSWSAVTMLQFADEERPILGRAGELTIFMGNTDGGADGKQPDYLTWFIGKDKWQIPFDRVEASITILVEEPSVSLTHLSAHYKSVLPGTQLAATTGQAKPITMAQPPMAQAHYQALQSERPPEARDGLLREFWLDERLDPDSGEWQRKVTLYDLGLQSETAYYYALFEPDPSQLGRRLFSMPVGARSGQLHLAEDLQPGIASPNLRALFQKRGEPLTLQAQVSVMVDANQWAIVDVPNRYMVQLQNGAVGTNQAVDVYLGCYRTERTWRSAATATGDYGLGERLYRLLPSIHQQYDEPAPGHDGAGQLRSFVEIFGAALDQVRSLDEDLASRHDIDQVRADLLPHLAHWIGWQLDDTLGTLAQRDEIRFAPARYATLGTRPNLRDLVYHVTGRACEIKEFVQNVFLTNAPEPIPFWEIWSGLLKPDHAWSEPPKVLVRADGFDGQPVALRQGALPGSTTVTSWLYWCSDRSGRRTLWQQELSWPRLKTPHPLDIGNVESGSSDEDPTVATVEDQPWLFWSTNRDGNWEIYARLSDISGSWIERLTNHPADDLHPTATVDADGTVWLFWQSNRRGPTDIWAQIKKKDESDWRLPTRITTAERSHEMPAAVAWTRQVGRVPINQIWLFWSQDQGDHRNIYYTVRLSSLPPNVAYNAGWAEPRPVAAGRWRDEAPTAVIWHEQLWLFWHSNRSGSWQIWGCSANGNKWSEARQFTAGPWGNKEPAVLVDGENLRLFWRSQRRGSAFQSRTLDFRDSEMVAQLGTFKDRAHYTYDTRPYNVANVGCDSNRYARGAVGIYLPPATSFLFSFTWAQVESQLWPQLFRGLFSTIDVEFPDTVEIKIEEVGRRWRITLEDTAYLAIRYAGRLHVHEGLFDDYIINVEWQRFEESVKNSSLVQALRDLFAEYGLVFPEDAFIETKERDRCWHIRNKNAELVYFAIRSAERFYVYAGLLGNELIDIAWSQVEAALHTSALARVFYQIFASAHRPLAANSQIVTQRVNQCWTITARDNGQDQRYVVIRDGSTLNVVDRDGLQQAHDFIEPFRPAQMQYIWKIGDETD